MSNRIRQKETSLRLAVDGQDQTGSFLKVVKFDVNPDQVITKTQFCGENRPDSDVDVNGYTITFEVQELDSKAEDLLNLIDANHKANLAQPLFVLTEYKKYRGTGAGDRTNVYGGASLICKRITNSEGGGYIGSQWEAFVPTRESL